LAAPMSSWTRAAAGSTAATRVAAGNGRLERITHARWHPARQSNHRLPGTWRGRSCSSLRRSSASRSFWMPHSGRNMAST
jgi:hypothetical protein